jgi:hypothetical protein
MNNGYLMVSCNGGLNQMRTGVWKNIYFQSAVASGSFVPALDFPNGAHQCFTMINKLHDEWGGGLADL